MRARLLLIEEVEADRWAFEEVVENTFPGLEVAMAWDREAVSDWLVGSPFDIVITNLSLGWTDGFDIMRRVRERWPTCLTVVLTEESSIVALDRAIELGAIDYILKSSGSIGMIKSLRFCLNRLKLSRRVRHVEDRLQRLLDRVKLGVFRMNARGRLIDANPALLKLLGISSVHDSVRINLREVLGVAGLETESSLQRFGVKEVRIPRADGSSVWASLTFALQRDEDGAIVLEGLAEDITARKEAEIEIRASNSRLKEALDRLNLTQQQVIRKERMAALGQMASGIAHDINNSLAQVSGFSELLESLPAESLELEKVRRYSAIIHKASGDAAATIAKLRKFYQPRDERAPRQPVRLDLLLREVLDFTRPMWKNTAGARGGDIELVLDLGPTPPLAGDPSQLRQVFTNLVFNALDAMPLGGRLRLHTRCEERQVIVAIEDSGVGMSEDVLMRCTEPFFTTKGEGGSGLGLGMAVDTVRDHKGELSLRSEPDGGTTVELVFALAEEGAGPSPAPSPRAAELVRAPRRRLLHVDDEAEIRFLLSEALGAGGDFEVVSLESAEEALGLLRDEAFDLIVTDRSMPGMGGDRFAMLAKELRPEVPIIMLTGFGDFMTWAEERLTTVDRVLSKPVDLAELKAVLREL